MTDMFIMVSYLCWAMSHHHEVYPTQWTGGRGQRDQFSSYGDCSHCAACLGPWGRVFRKEIKSRRCHTLLSKGHSRAFCCAPKGIFWRPSSSTLVVGMGGNNLFSDWKIALAIK